MLVSVLIVAAIAAPPPADMSMESAQMNTTFLALQQKLHP